MGTVGKRSKKSGGPAVPQSAAGALAARESMVIPEGYVRARKLVEDGAPLVFVSGNAGTGKTTLIRYLRDSLDCRCVVLAPTGVAALNAGGATVHSFFRFPPRVMDPNDIEIPKDPRLYQSLELIIIDEVSMLRADVLDCIDVFLRACQGSSAPFGGVRMLFIGDLFQLPPVTSNVEGEILASRGYATPYFFSAFCLEDLPLAHVELDEVLRQTDAEFVGLLNRLRVGEGVAGAVEALNQRCTEDTVTAADDARRDITLTCTNRVADDINAAAMASLAAEEVLLRGELEGRFRLSGDRLPSPLELRLKMGARVMFTKNDESGRWVNGTLGTVTWAAGSRVEVRLDEGDVLEVEPVSWQTYEYRLDSSERRIVAEEVGSYRQYPLMLAWAVTIHKSQGKTLDNVLVDFGWGAFAPGQAYVALSRCRSLEGIRLTRPLRPSDIKCDSRVRRFHDGLAARAAMSEG